MVARDGARSVVVTVSGTIDPAARVESAAGRRPRLDYDELAAAMGGEVLDHATAARASGRVARRLARALGHDAVLAWVCFRRRKSLRVLFTDSERVGMLYAALSLTVRSRPRHVMIGHRLSTGSKMRMHRLLGLRRRIDQVVVYSSAQRAVAIDLLGYPPDRVTLTPFMVDTGFWRRDGLMGSGRSRPMVCAVGQELRDYPTLVEAARGLDVDVVLAAASPWSKRADSSSGLEIPANVSVGRFDQFDLRQLYAEATLVVVPLQETDFQAGITTILEAMSMGVAVVCSRTRGQTDTIVDGVTGRYVAVDDPLDLRRTISELLDNRAERERIARAGQDWVRSNADIGHYSARLAALTVGDA